MKAPTSPSSLLLWQGRNEFAVIFSSASNSLLPPSRDYHGDTYNTRRPSEPIRSSIHHIPTRTIPLLKRMVYRAPYSSAPQGSKSHQSGEVWGRHDFPGDQ